MSNKKIIYYLNQFFGQIGGEEKASIAPLYKEEAIGPAMQFGKLVADKATVVGTIICGDNYFNENNEESLEFIKKVLDTEKPDMVVAGPAFNAGRYGMACAGVADFISKNYDIPVLSGMYEENPGLDITRHFAFTVLTKNSAADMRHALKDIAVLANKVLDGVDIRPETDNYVSQGRRLTVFSEKRGSQRAVEMLLKRLNNEEFKTELPMPTFDSVEPAPAIKDLKNAVIAVVTTGGIVPLGNPDKIQSASAQIWGKYDISDRKNLENDFCTIHGGFDPVYANEKPDRIIPVDILKTFEDEGKIGKVYKYLYTTTGTGTAVGNSITFGKEMGKELKEAGVDGVVITST